MLSSNSRLHFQIRSDTSLCVDKTVPDIQAKCESMQQIFERIDKLEVSGKNNSLKLDDVP